MRRRIGTPAQRSIPLTISKCLCIGKMYHLTFFFFFCSHQFWGPKSGRGQSGERMLGKEQQFILEATESHSGFYSEWPSCCSRCSLKWGAPGIVSSSHSSHGNLLWENSIQQKTDGAFGDRAPGSCFIYLCVSTWPWLCSTEAVKHTHGKDQILRDQLPGGQSWPPACLATHWPQGQ